MPLLRFPLPAIVAGLALAGCSGSSHEHEPVLAVADGHPERAPALFKQYGCSACHRIPGVEGAQGGVGPPLAGFAQRVYVGGTLPNTPANLMRWLQHPQGVAPGNAMPEMGVTEQDARDMAAYLYSLR